ncbi:hypothetical protein FTO74_11895 [Granulicella sp. WH15]|uniref:hypothetical protein n=1 Tax=Granulicella sp. WH15 TaxID=2602070 RepID=UPI0013678E2A|nr:hypothetical protein [Granulicella sp. WH15]QHN03996.1 hypothetical protein FTO74_11895 [Granulicella sp. WH15]
MTGETSPDEEIEQAIQKSAERVEELALSIRDTSAGEEDVWFRNLLLGILNSALLDFRYLQIGKKQRSPYLAAWSCRNLLELKVIAIYVLASADNARTFKNDFVVDAKEFYEAISNRHRATHPKLIAAWQAGMQEFQGDDRRALEAALQREIERGPQTQETDEETEAYRKLMGEFGISPKSKPMRSGEIAKLISQNEEFSPMFKVCSKIMHRTALSIAASTTKGSLDEVIPLLASTGAIELMAIYDMIDQHFRAHGVQLP